MQQTGGHRNHRTILGEQACRVVRASLEEQCWRMHTFDWVPIFSCCQTCSNEKKLSEEARKSYGWTRPDFLAKSLSGNLCLLEVKGKSRRKFVVDDFRYESYVYWERFLGIPAFVVFYVSSDNRQDDSRLYLHKVLDEDVRIGDIGDNLELLVDTEGNVSQTNDKVISLKRIDSGWFLSEELEQQIDAWDVSESLSKWIERKDPI